MRVSLKSKMLVAFTMIVLPLSLLLSPSFAMPSKVEEISSFPLMDFTSVSIGPSENVESASISSVDYPPWEIGDYLPINVWAVADEEFRSKDYETTWFQKISWDDYVKKQIERADDRLYEVFGIDLCIISVGSWESTNTLTGQDLLFEAIEKTGFVAHKTVVNGEHVDVLIAFTGQNLGYAACAYKPLKAVITTAQAYWADDNIIRHEVCHLFGTHDHEDERDPHFWDDCIMSYRFTFVEFIIEDGWIWHVACDVVLAALSNEWCSECVSIILWQKLYFFPIHSWRFGIPCSEVES